MKTCSKCKKELPLTNFYPNKRLKSGCSSWCKECVSADGKLRYIPCSVDKSVANARTRASRERKIAYVQTFKTPCAKCGCTTPYVLTFHHIDYKTKSFDVGKAYLHGYEDIDLEIKKCICLCYNCHHTFHYFYGMQPENPIESLDEFLRGDWTPDMKIT